jgi:hypothetical protein
MTKIVTDQLQRREGAEFTLPLRDGTAGQALLTDGKGNLTFVPPPVEGGPSGPVGQAFYGFGAGTYAWTCPPGVTSVCVVCIGGGASSSGATSSGNGGGGGGGLGWKNNISVEPGKTYTVQVGKGGNLGGTDPAGGTSFFIDTATVRGGGSPNKSGGTWTGDGGGNGGSGASSQAGGGAGGYTGNGGNSGGSAGSGGGAGGGGNYSSTHGYSSGGGTGPFGQGASGAGTSYDGGKGGSGGEDGRMGENPWYSYGTGERPGGLYGGGGGGPGDNSAFGHGIQVGGRGCVRIIWGTGRKFPSTGTGDM